MKKFEDFKMQPNETIMEMELRFTRLMGDLSDLGKELTEKEMNLKILRGLPKSWEMKVIAMRDNRDMKTTPTAKIFSDLKAYEFEHEPKDAEEPETRNIALVANQAASNPNSHRKRHESFPQASKTETTDSQLLCYNCRKPGHFKANCPYPMVSKYQDGNNITSSSRESGEKHKKSDKPESSNSKSEGRRKAMVVAENTEKAIPETKSNADLNQEWHNKLSHLNMKTINKLAKRNLVRGLPETSYTKDRLCDACQKGKQLRSSFKSKDVDTSSRSLSLLHMDLFGPIDPASLSGRKNGSAKSSEATSNRKGSQNNKNQIGSRNRIRQQSDKGFLCSKWNISSTLGSTNASAKWSSRKKK
ncbi:PREDICTED: uncharacterized protein LOC109163743 [Ipomoea nil]|uniref:uncharacterized protein LOC109163743 n=1 Tax=Ipomoea nil TaxID=35883 RepID=UPI000900C7D8|nr:PREDICTED: uncharacterized protein LOC109163743 [Ipomoea nil]